MRLILAYALLIQGFAGPLSSTLHSLALDGIGGTSELCQPSRQDTPQPHPAAHDGLCCLLGCMSGQPASAGPAPVSIGAPERLSAALRLDTPDSRPLPSARRGGFEARGPPGIA